MFFICSILAEAPAGRKGTPMDLDPHSPEFEDRSDAEAARPESAGAESVRVADELIAKQIISSLRQSRWRLIKMPPEIRRPMVPTLMREMILRRRRQERLAFEDLLAVLLRARGARTLISTLTARREDT